jgi:peptidoglycan/xylan/chitin deacetylase (PgdA/CDA1 family)
MFNINRRGLMIRMIFIFYVIFFTQSSFGQTIGNLSIPALSYHNVRTYTTQNPAYFITPERLEEQLKKLKELGYKTVLPSEVESVFYEESQIPEKSILISFDDTRVDHYLSAAPVLEKYGFRGTFFIMTVSIGKPGYMTKAQIKELSDRGHAIELHTWDHQDLRKIAEDQWKIQIDRPKALLEEITGKPVTSLAYPFGLWNSAVVLQIKSRGLSSAFQLGGKLATTDPVFSLPRILVPGNWTGDRLINEIENRFSSGK